MPLNFDPTGDFAEVADGTETVTLRRRGSSGQTTVTGVLRRSLTTREVEVRNRYDTWKQVASDGRATAAEAVWHLSDEQLSDAPRLGDLIVDGDAKRWTILDARLATLQTRWLCVTCNLAVVYGLDDTINVLKATYVKGDGGAAEPVWRPWRTGIRARIQVATADVDNEHQARRTVTRYRIFIEEDLTLDHTHCIQGPDGTVYKILGASGAERVGELQTIDAETTPWPAG